MADDNINERNDETESGKLPKFGERLRMPDMKIGPPDGVRVEMRRTARTDVWGSLQRADQIYAVDAPNGGRVTVCWRAGSIYHEVTCHEDDVPERVRDLVREAQAYALGERTRRLQVEM